MAQTNFALKAAIYRRGLRQMQAAEAVGLTETSFSHVVTGRRPPSDDVRKRLAEILEVYEAELFPDVSEENLVR